MADKRLHEVDYRPGSNIGVLALHADIEGGTGELAELIVAETGATLLTFRQPGEDPIRIPSVCFDEIVYPELRRFVDSVDFVLSLHGHARDGDLSNAILLGGTRRRAASLIARSLRSGLGDHSIIDDIELIPSNLRGLHPNNPVNASRRGGVQAELSVRARGCQPLDQPNQPAEPKIEVAAAFVEGLQAVEQELIPARFFS